MLTAENAAAGYAALFDPLTRAAHRACLEHAAVTQPDGWPTLRDCLAFAQFYGIEAAPFAAFFGYVCWSLGKRTTWVDAHRGDAATWEAQRLMTDDQAVAFGFHCVFADIVAGKSRR
jgi:hypothetical protein